MQKTPARPALTGPRTPFPLLRFGMLLRGRSTVDGLYLKLDEFSGSRPRGVEMPMKKSHFTEEQIVYALRQAATGK